MSDPVKMAIAKKIDPTRKGILPDQASWGHGCQRTYAGVLGCCREEATLKPVDVVVAEVVVEGKWGADSSAKDRRCQ